MQEPLSKHDGPRNRTWAERVAGRKEAVSLLRERFLLDGDAVERASRRGARDVPASAWVPGAGLEPVEAHSFGRAEP